ncbi:hypothetical protein ACFFU1_14610, partial [Algibacter miyuki]
TETIVDIPASVVNQFENIVNEGPVTINGETFNTIEEYIENIVATNETVTTLVDNTDGTYTYTSEDGTETIVDVPASVVNQFENIVNEGPVTINGETFNTIEEYIENIVTTNETVTTLVDNTDGTYTYTSEDGTETIVDVPASVVNQFENIVNEGPVTINGETFNTIEEYIENIVATNETVTTLVDNTDGTYTYTSEDGTETIVDIPASVVNQFENIVNEGPVTINGETFNTIEEYIENIVTTNETVTTLVDNTDGTYTYTSEDGTETIVDIPASVVNQFENIVNEGPVTINGETFNTIEEYIENIVATNETVTTLVDNTDGTYTYTSEDGTETIVDIPASVVNQFENIVNEGPVTINGETFNTIEEYIENIVTTNETVTTLVDNTDGTYTYTSEDGTETIVDIPASVVNQFENIVNEGPVTINGETFNTIEEYIENIVATNETVTTLVDNTDGTYTYTSEDGTETIVDIPASVVNQFENIVNEGPVTINGETFNTIEEYIENIVATNETVTTLVDNTDGTYTYTSEDGTETIVDIPASVVNQFENIVNEGPVTINGETFNTIEEYIENIVATNETVTTLVDNTDGTYTYTSEDGTETIVDIPASVVNQFENIVNEGPVTINGETFNTIEEYIENIVATNETNTALAITNGELVYTNENADNANVNLISGDTDNAIVVGADGALFVPEVEGNTSEVTQVVTTGNAIATHDDGTGNTVDVLETVTTFNDTDGDGIFTYTSEDGTETEVAGKEPWFNQDTGIQATLNTQNIYQTGNVAIQKDENFDGTALDVQGAVRGGNDPKGSVGAYSAAFGHQNIASGAQAVALVNKSEATGNSSFAAGNVAKASGLYSIALGSQSEALENYSIVMGTGLIADDTNETVLGKYNADNASLDAVFQIGNGSNEGSRSNALTILKNGNIGTDTAIDATEKLDIGSGNVRVRDINTNIGAATDNVVVADANGVLKTISAVSLETTASNGTNIDVTTGDVQLGGNLIKGTTITQNGNEFEIETGGSNLVISGLDKTKVQDYTGNKEQHLLAVDANNQVTALKAAMPKFFYMPSVMVPTAESHLGQTGVTYNNTSRTGTIDLYAIYAAQFGSPVISSEAVALPVLPANELVYHVTYATPDVFTITGLTTTGMLTYTVSATASPNVGTFMNIVFSVKED